MLEVLPKIAKMQASYTNMLCHTPTLTSVGLHVARKTLAAALAPPNRHQPYTKLHQHP